MTRRYSYIGDVSIEHGGYFYCLDTWKWDYVDVVRVTPCSDAGGPDNIFWVEKLTVNIREGDKLAEVLKTCDALDATPKTASGKARILDAHVWYGAYDVDSNECIRIGKPDPYYPKGDFHCDKILRAGTSLYEYARKQCSR